MIWLTWRQARTQVSVILVAVAALAVLMAITGPHLFDVHHLYEESFLDRIRPSTADKTLYIIGVVLTNVAPAVIGAFWGAPLIAREFEAGTHRLVWNQSVTRTRWLAAKLGLTALAAMVVTGLLSLAVTWWSSPIDAAVEQGQAAGPFSLTRLYPVLFGARGVVPLGYALFAVVLGVAVGLVLRRSVAAIAVTLVVMLAVQIAMPLLVRAHLIPAKTVTLTLSADNFRGLMTSGPEPSSTAVATGPVEDLTVNFGAPGDWQFANQTVNAAGKVVKTLPSWVADCGQLPPRTGASQADRARLEPVREACFARLSQAGYRQQVIYQPAGRFWGLQWREAGLFAVLSLLLAGFCFWRIRRDLS
jgi:hypothetical protein